MDPSGVEEERFRVGAASDRTTHENCGSESLSSVFEVPPLHQEQAWAAGSSKLGKAEFQGTSTQSGMGLGHHAVLDGRRLALPGGGDGPFFKTDHWLVDAEDASGRTGSGRVGDGDPTKRRGGS